MGQTLDLHYATVILLLLREIFFNREIKAGIHSIEAINEDIWFVVDIELENIEWINIKNKTKYQFNMNVNGIRITDNCVMYATDIKNSSFSVCPP